MGIASQVGDETRGQHGRIVTYYILAVRSQRWPACINDGDGRKRSALRTKNSDLLQGACPTTSPHQHPRALRRHVTRRPATTGNRWKGWRNSGEYTPQ